MNNLIQDDSVERAPVVVDDDITNAIELIQASYNSTKRVKALSNTREDKQIYESLTDSLTSTEVFAQIKDTTMMQVMADSMGH